MAAPTAADTYRACIERFPEMLRPVSFLAGEEGFFIDRLEERLIGLIPEEQRDFNLNVIYGSESSIDRVLDIARSYPMMGELRVVIVREFQSLRSSGKDGTPEQLAAYVERPNPSTVLVLTDVKAPDKRSLLGKTLAARGRQGGGIHSFDPLPIYRVPDWIQEWAMTHHGKRISQEASTLLADLAGSDLTILSSELDKLSTYVDTRPEIQSDDVRGLIGSTRDISTFELTDALFDRDLPKTLMISERLLRQRGSDTGEILKTVGLLYSSFSTIWQIVRLKEKGLNDREIQTRLSITNDYYFKRLLRSASRFRLTDMPRVFEALLDADAAAKGFGLSEPSTILPLTFSRILGGGD